MQIEFIENVGLSDKSVPSYMLFSTKPILPPPPKQYSCRKIAIFALDKTPESLAILASRGIKPDVFCNSDPNLTGKKYLGYNIVNTWELIEQKNIYNFIIPASPHLSAIIRQLKLHEIEDYSFLWKTVLPNFEFLQYGDKLKNNYIQVINSLMKYYLSDDYWIGAGKPENGLLSQVFLHRIHSINWSSKIYEWFYEDMSEKNMIYMLDIGPGNGLFSAMVKNIMNSHIDWIELSFNTAKCPLGIADNIFVGNIETDDIPIKNKYDLIVMTEVIEHFRYNPVPTLMKIRNYLKPNGLLYISCPHFANLFSYPSWEDMPELDKELPFEYYGHNYEFSHEELHEIFVKAELAIVREGFSVQGHSNFALRSK